VKTNLMELLDFLQRLNQLLDLAASRGGIGVLDRVHLLGNVREPRLQILISRDSGQRLLTGEVLRLSNQNKWKFA
jgi:hypothetical protein